MTSELLREATIEAVIEHPELSHQQIADQFGIARLTLIKVCVKAGIRRTRGAGSYAWQCQLAKKITGK
jgi:hypothetical protein